MKTKRILAYSLLVVLCVFGVSLELYGQAHDGHEHGESEKEHAHEEHKSDSHEHEDQEEEAHEGGHGESSPVQWTEELLKESQIELKPASASEILVGLELPGKIVSYEPNVAHIIPRFPGIIKEARKHLGESVKKGDVLAVIESNQSLNPYEVKSPITGVVVKRHSTVGEYASETTDIFVVADLSQVWGEFYVFSDNFGEIEVGAPVVVEAKPLKEPITSSVSFVSKIVDEHTQSKFVRAILENSKGLLYPGAFANALVVLRTIQADVTVQRSALQRLEGEEVVFTWEGETFEARPVLTGKRDKNHVQILRGLKAGERYAIGNTFLIKAEIGKSEAEHAH
jgi:cobalt-zinc-cadmium efflux system membrane fusion protein